MYVRNKCFDWGILKQNEFDVPIISVGNLAVGGTGKTPHVEYIVEALRYSYHIAVLSRGYKRHTRGFIVASRRSTPRDIGDEAYQIYNKFNGQVLTVVCEERAKAIDEILRIDPDVNLIVLDDAFQHRYVKPTVSVVVTEYNRPFYNDKMLPYGRLREPARGINRADIVIVSKCPDEVSALDNRLVIKNLELFPYQKLFLSRFVYQGLTPLFPENVTAPAALEWLTHNDSVLAIAGIGNPKPFIRHIKSFMAVTKVNIFSDHHYFTRKDLDLIKRRYESLKGNRRIIITTEKDAVRLATNPYFPHELKAVTFFLPIKVDVALSADNKSFIDTLRLAINAHKR